MRQACTANAPAKNAKNMLLFLDIGGGELLLIILVGMLLFGTDKLPGIIRGIAKGTDYIKKASAEVREQITRETGLDEAIGSVKETVSKTVNDISEGFDPEFKNAADNPEAGKSEKTAAQSEEQQPGDTTTGEGQKPIEDKTDNKS